MKGVFFFFNCLVSELWEISSLSVGRYDSASLKKIKSQSENICKRFHLKKSLHLTSGLQVVERNQNIG